MPQHANSRREIFVMDDDAEMRERLSVALQEDGYDVICFADGAALLSAAKTRTPTCIFLELRHPGKSGLDILKKLRAENYSAPIFIISGQGDIPTAVEAIRCGALDFIEKPPCSVEMIARVKAAMSAHSHRPATIGPARNYPHSTFPAVSP